MNWNSELEEKTKSIWERLEKEQFEIERKISFYENFEANKASLAEITEYYMILMNYITLQRNHTENENLLKLDLHTFAIQQRIGIEDWTFHPIDIDDYRTSSSLTFEF